MVDLTSAQIESFPYGEWSKQRELGDSHWYSITRCRNKCGEGPHGIIQPHLTEEGDWCGGAVTFAGHDPGKRREGDVWMPGPTWTLVSLEPLTLEPSLQCTVCPDHGFIKEGRWVRA